MISHEELTARLSYDGQTGLFTWVNPLSNRVQVGAIAGTKITGGYLGINIRGKRYAAHRLAWFYVHGEWPEKEIDHIDRNPLNNAIANLRDVNRVVNALNTGAKSGNTSGIKGVTWCSKRNQWQAQIHLSGKNITLGRFETIDEAAIAYKAALMVAEHFLSSKI
ncbi:HNH endonuclease [Serratia marcescens]|uniref:HNH endonuclease n=1 Tax=Serratia marcescens TaxID=615 RepID=UPI003A83B3F7